MNNDISAHLRIALVNLRKPHDLAIVAQLAIAFKQIRVFAVGKTLDLSNLKVHNKLASWHVDLNKKGDLHWERVACLDELKERGLRLISASPQAGQNLFSFDVQQNDVFVFGGAEGLSKSSLAFCDDSVTIPCSQEVPFLMVGTAVPMIIGAYLKSLHV